jgi:hypothetical protein
MLQQFIGTDPWSAAVLIAAIACVCVVATTIIGKRQNADDVRNRFELEKLKIAADDRQRLYGLETNREAQIRSIESKVITSHREGSDRG